ncbi:hypothetical protein [Rasiella sp. SM2506]|uniref:hypothetical protein n=1 Tax=Rasiella sp. SM2506 TaxID=3423914 RepID=UPI003D7A91C0
MKKETTESDLHSRALVWKTISQETQELLQRIEKILHIAKLNLDALDTEEALEGFSNTAKHYSERNERLQQRITHFEDKLSVMNECDTSECDLEFSDEVEAISMEVEKGKNGSSILASEISSYTDCKLSD